MEWNTVFSRPSFRRWCDWFPCSRLVLKHCCKSPRDAIVLMCLTMKNHTETAALTMSKLAFSHLVCIFFPQVSATKHSGKNLGTWDEFNHRHNLKQFSSCQRVWKVQMALLHSRLVFCHNDEQNQWGWHDSHWCHPTIFGWTVSQPKIPHLPFQHSSRFCKSFESEC